EEWCADWYGEDYYSYMPAHNPRGPEISTQYDYSDPELPNMIVRPTKHRVVRGLGGGSDPIPNICYRDGQEPWHRDPIIGFRCAKSA
ncbi:MAG TPA: hypothetical protein VGK34_08965, partial [Armatimonadota bacterium]